MREDAVPLAVPFRAVRAAGLSRYTSLRTRPIRSGTKWALGASGVRGDPALSTELEEPTGRSSLKE
jgi:hypothetical protein